MIQSPSQEKNFPSRQPESFKDISQESQRNPQELEILRSTKEGLSASISESAPRFFGFTQEQLDLASSSEKFNILAQAQARLGSFQANPYLIDLRVHGGELSQSSQSEILNHYLKLLQQYLDETLQYEQALNDISVNWKNLSKNITGFSFEEFFKAPYEQKMKMLDNAQRNLKTMKNNPQTVRLSSSTVSNSTHAKITQKLISMTEDYLLNLEKDVQANLYFDKFIKDAPKNFLTIVGFSPQDFNSQPLESKQATIAEAQKRLDEAKRISSNQLNLQAFLKSAQVPAELENSLREKILNAAYDYLEAFRGVALEEESLASKARNRAARHAQEFISTNLNPKNFLNLTSQEKAQKLKTVYKEITSQFHPDRVDFKTNKEEWYFKDEAFKIIMEAYNRVK
jgi:hypothetical protein